jgi:hypothetical protein
MAVASTSDVASETQPHGARWGRATFFVVLSIWNICLLGSMAYTLWTRHHPNIQAGQNNVALSVELYSLVLGNIAIPGLGYVAHRLARRRRLLTVA